MTKKNQQNPKTKLVCVCFFCWPWKTRL